MKKLPRGFIKRQSGQALLLILLVLSLVLTLVLASVSQSVTDVEISKYEDNAIRAFDAAQAGIEKIVVGAASGGGSVVTLDNQASFIATSGTLLKVDPYSRYPIELYSGESAVFWLVGHTYDATNDVYEIDCPGPLAKNIPSQMAVCWGKEGTSELVPTTPAVHIEFYYTSEPNANLRCKYKEMADLSDIEVLTFSADPYIVSGLASPRGNFSVPRATTGYSKCDNANLAFSTGFNRNDAGDVMEYLQSHSYLLLMVRVTILYNNIPQPVAIKLTGGGGEIFASQGVMVSSTGFSGDVSRKLILNQGFPEIPGEFSQAIYTHQNLNKPS